jgi:glucose/arabinose dehydrogenase
MVGRSAITASMWIVPSDPALVAKGLAFYNADFFPTQYRSGAFIGQHGSWNRKPFSGYKVIFVPLADGRPSGLPMDVLTGFVDSDGKALGRPVGVAVDKTGALLVADDVGNTVWRVRPASAQAASTTSIGGAR